MERIWKTVPFRIYKQEYEMRDQEPQSKTIMIKITHTLKFAGSKEGGFAGFVPDWRLFTHDATMHKCKHKHMKYKIGLVHNEHRHEFGHSAVEESW